MRLVYGADAAVAAWAAARLPYAGHPPPEAVAIGVVENDLLIGAAVFTGFIAEYQGIEMSVVAETPRAVTRSMIRAVLAYPFEQLKCRWVQMHALATNARSIRLARFVGFVPRGIEPHYYAPGEHRMTLTMLAAQWPRLCRRL